MVIIRSITIAIIITTVTPTPLVTLHNYHGHHQKHHHCYHHYNSYTNTHGNIYITTVAIIRSITIAIIITTATTPMAPFTWHASTWADRLASSADLTSGLQLGRVEVLRGLRNFLNMDRPEYHSTDRLKERGAEKGSGRHSTLQGRERSVFNQANIDTVLGATLGRLLRGRAERVWAFPSAMMPSWTDTETKLELGKQELISISFTLEADAFPLGHWGDLWDNVITIKSHSLTEDSSFCGTKWSQSNPIPWQRTVPSVGQCDHNQIPFPDRGQFLLHLLWDNVFTIKSYSLREDSSTCTFCGTIWSQSNPIPWQRIVPSAPSVGQMCSQSNPIPWQRIVPSAPSVGQCIHNQIPFPDRG